MGDRRRDRQGENIKRKREKECEEEGDRYIERREKKERCRPGAVRKIMIFCFLLKDRGEFF